MHENTFAIVASRFNLEIIDNLVEGAQQVLRQAGVEDSQVELVRVPGAWEIPLAAQNLAQRGDLSAIICLGAVIKGQTSHDEHINRFVSMALGQIGLEFDLPVTFGILTVNNRQQAIDRSGGSVANRGAEAAAAALEMCEVLDQLRDGN